MQSTLVQKTSVDKKDISNSVPVSDVKSDPKIEHGSEVGMPLFLQRALTSTASPPPEVQRMCADCEEELVVDSPQVQPKLTIGEPNDTYEQEADNVADQVMRMPEPASNDDDEMIVQTKPLANQITPLVQRAPAEETSEDERLVQMMPESIQPKHVHGQSSQISPTAAANIHSLNGSGSPLPRSARSFFEPRFSDDFSQVRVHTDTRAAETAKSINARAFTHGKNVVFGAGEYSSDSGLGRRLLAHELTHVVQQEGNSKNQASQQKTLQRSTDYEELRKKFGKGKNLDKLAKDFAIDQGFKIAAETGDMGSLAKSVKDMIKAGIDIQDSGKSDWWFNDDEKIKHGQQILAVAKGYKSTIDAILKIKKDVTGTDEWLVDSKKGDGYFKAAGIMLNSADLVDKWFETNEAQEKFMNDPENMEDSLIWASEVAELFQTVGSLVGALPYGGIFEPLFKIPSSAVSAFSNILINHIYQIDKASGGLTTGASIEMGGVGGKKLTGEGIGLYRGLGNRQHNFSKQLIEENHEMIAKLPIDRIKKFLVHRLINQSIDEYGRTNPDDEKIANLAAERRYIEAF